MAVKNREIWLAFLGMVLISLVYGAVVTRTGSIPAARGLFGHSLGVIGFLLMLSTETLYSLRKRSRTARWGRMSSWLQFHIFTGLVGPFLVLLHTSWKFHGLAGVVLLFTVIIVISGFIGRYIYTAVPRTVDGAEIQSQELEARIGQVELELSQWMAAQPGDAWGFARQLSSFPTGQAAGPAVVAGRFLSDLRYQAAWQRKQRGMDASLRAQAKELKRLVDQQRLVKRQMASLAAARQLLAAWHVIHIPIGMVLFSASLFHILGAIYFATLLR